jgi:hypothetical protein
MSSNQPDNNPGTPYSAWGKYIDAVAAGEASPQDDLDWNETGLYGSFGSNSWIYNYTTKTEEASKFWRTINVEGTDRIPLIADCQHIGGRPNVTDDFPVYNGEWDYGGRGGASMHAIKRFMMDRHQGGIHVVLFDLSVRKVGVKAVAWWLRWHRGYTGAEVFNEWDFDRNNKWSSRSSGGVGGGEWINPYRYHDY